MADVGAAAQFGTGHLRMFSPYTGERVEVNYRRRGRYDPDALGQLAHFFRDWHKEQPGPLDPRLCDALSELQRRLDGRPIQVTCGYRTPTTNRLVGGEKNSYHMLGMAADIRVDGVSTQRLYRTLVSMKAGGVGIYPGQRFCHLDVGEFRTWRG
ncbi:MAG TPA: DUF882 domain-containing protein [Azospirillaceae bacterium]|nr:DUF882 domain-containing protein [Azospirillaceae bacterium]